MLEQVQQAPLRFIVRGEGELKSVKNTRLLVPGAQWTSRQLKWVLPDGSRVSKGEVVARFSAEKSRQNLIEAQVDIKRNALERDGKQDKLADQRVQLSVDLAQVATQLSIAERYANAPLAAMARNDFLDAVQDVHYLRMRQDILQWRRHQLRARGRAELAVLDAQRNNYVTVEKQKQADLDSLELRAPHDGVLMLERDWSQQLPQIGSSLYAGNDFASLPDLNALEVEVYVPQIEAQGIRVGDKVELYRWGLPAQRVDAKVSWVADVAEPRSRNNPVKYLAVKAVVPVSTAHRYGWMPGMRLNADIVLLDVIGYSVPNLALNQDGGTATVQILAGGKRTTRKLVLGTRGPSRTQVLKGLVSGDQVLLSHIAEKGER